MFKCRGSNTSGKRSSIDVSIVYIKKVITWGCDLLVKVAVD